MPKFLFKLCVYIFKTLIALMIWKALILAGGSAQISLNLLAECLQMLTCINVYGHAGGSAEDSIEIFIGIYFWRLIALIKD